MERTYDEIVTAMQKLNYTFFAGEKNLNFIWERTSDEITNKFTDFLHIAYQSQGENLVFTIPATTKPGIKGSIDSPVTYEGVTGTAIIIPGQYHASWEFIDTPVPPTGKHYPLDKEYFRQVKPVNYWRDGNKDLVVDHVQEQDNQIFGTHWHKMSNPGASGFGVNNWSLGCMGAEQPEFIKILPLVRSSVPLYGSVFTGTVLESKDFV